MPKLAPNQGSACDAAFPPPEHLQMTASFASADEDGGENLGIGKLAGEKLTTPTRKTPPEADAELNSSEAVRSLK